MKRKFDIFISYRRANFESANMIATALKARGYRTFIDVEGLGGGHFNEQLYEVIDGCKDFILVLSPNALDRCNDEGDWVRKEVTHAIATKKNIIPFLCAGFTWPEKLAEGLEDLPLYQSVSSSSTEYFNMVIERLCKKYLKSHTLLTRLIVSITGAAVSVALLLGLLFGILRLVSVPFATEVGVEMLTHSKELDMAATKYSELYNKWNKFNAELKNNVTLEDIADDLIRIVSEIEKTQSYFVEYPPKDTAEREFTLYESLLLISRGVPLSDLSMEPVIQSEIIGLIHENLDYMHLMLVDSCYSSYNLEMCSIYFNIFESMCRSYLYSNAEVLRLMPDEIKHQYEQLSVTFESLPNDIPLTLSKDEYVRKEEIESHRLQQLCDNMSVLNEKGVSLSEESEMHEEVINSTFTNMWKVVLGDASRTNVFATMAQSAQPTQVESESQLVEDVDAIYDSLLKTCTISKEDDLWEMWGKISRLAKNLEKELTFKNSHLSSQVLYSDLVLDIDLFKKYHPEFTNLAEAIKVFYKEVSDRRRSMAGVLVFDIKDGVTHPVFKSGDIVISMKGTDISNLDELKTAYKKEGVPAVSFLRLENGALVEHKVDDCGDVSIVRFVDIRKL